MKKANRGFTLLEVLIALVVTATALALGIGAIRSGAQTLARLEDTTLAQFALENALNTLALAPTAVAPGRRDDVETLLGRSYAVTSLIARPADVLPFTVFNVTVSAREVPEVPLASGRREEIDVPLAP